MQQTYKQAIALFKIFIALFVLMIVLAVAFAIIDSHLEYTIGYKVIVGCPSITAYATYAYKQLRKEFMYD